MNSDLKKHIESRANDLFVKVKSYREHIHANPELSYEEHETMQYVADQLDKIGIEYQKEVGGTGITALIKPINFDPSQPCIALRADMDALPIQEENEVPYKSKKAGIMHACGHDVHTSVLLGAAEIIHELKTELKQAVKLIFQPGEEKNPGGATLMIADGVLQKPPVGEIYALHVFPDLEVGNFGFKEGIYMASCDEIHLTIHGLGGHGATPHRCIDPIVIGSEIVLNLQQIVSRKCDPKIPCVLSFGHFEALGATNIIPSTAKLKGTFRTMNEEWREEALKLIESRINDIVKSHGATAELEISKGYPYLENDPALTAQLSKASKDFFGDAKVHELPIRLTAEDFSYYSQEVPACFFRLGVGNKEKGITYGVHHPRFNIDDRALIFGVQAMVLAVLK